MVVGKRLAVRWQHRPRVDILEFFNPQEVTFDIIFVTAYNEYALQAFKISAFDYLLKPVSQEELGQTLQRYQSKQHKRKTVERINLLQQAYREGEVMSQLAISSTQGIEFITIDDILYLEASGTYTTLFLKGNNTIVSSKPIGEFEELLNKRINFFRPHRSYLINLQTVRKLTTKEGDMITLNSGAEIPLSRYRKKDFEERIQGFKIWETGDDAEHRNAWHN